MTGTAEDTPNAASLFNFQFVYGNDPLRGHVRGFGALKLSGSLWPLEIGPLNPGNMLLISRIPAKIELNLGESTQNRYNIPVLN